MFLVIQLFMMKYFLFDETEFKLQWELFSGISFCIFDNLDHIKKIAKYLKLRKIWKNAAYANIEYVHYTQDTPTTRTLFIEEMSKVSFKAYISIRKWRKANIYKNKNTLNLFKNSILKLKKFGNDNIELIFEEWKNTDYELLLDIAKKHRIQTTLKISKKHELYSSFPDYFLWVTYNYLNYISQYKTLRERLKIYVCNINKKITKSRSKNTNKSIHESDLDTIHNKISIFYFYHNWDLISFCASKHNYEEWKKELTQKLLKKSR